MESKSRGAAVLELAARMMWEATATVGLLAFFAGAALLLNLGLSALFPEVSSTGISVTAALETAVCGFLMLAVWWRHSQLEQSPQQDEVVGSELR